MFWTNLLSTFVTIPLLIILTARFEGPGAASVWLMINASYLLTQVRLMHRRFLVGERWGWYVEDCGIPLLACIAVSSISAQFSFAATTRTGIILLALISGSLALCAAALSTPLVRNQIRGLVMAKARAAHGAGILPPKSPSPDL